MIMELPENKLTNFIHGNQKAKWRPVSNHNINNFTEDEIKRITNNYGTPIGKGGFGQVYQGSLDDGTLVAVKKYICQNLKEGFAKEITVHCQINHKNVVRLYGYCTEENALMIVTEYVPRGNLRDLLHGSDDPISLDTRLGIAIECADALGYMHSSMYQPIIHGDIKPDNILLDSELHVKLSDFGLSRLLSMETTHQYTMNVAGSRGYMDPEHIETGILDTKSDVYSFGVVLLELITRDKASESGFSTGLKRNFIDALKKGKQEARQMFDTEIANERNMTVLDEIGTLAAECFSKGIKERPEMRDVQRSLQVLREALHHEQAQEKKGHGVTQETLQNVNKHEAGISSSHSTSIGTYKLSMLDIFSRDARRCKRNFDRNAGPILERAAPTLTIFTKRSIQKISGDFSHSVSKGGHGIFYLGITEDGTPVALERSNSVDDDRRDDFVKAVQSLSRISHKNIVRFMGCCLETDIPVLVYEYDAKRTLNHILHGTEYRLLLEWRLDIAIGSAEALAYLNSLTPIKIVHGNFKSGNILLDDSLLPKVVSDIYLLGLSQSRSLDMAYVDPVYYKTGLFTSKSDVYSFGVVLLELITRKDARYGGNLSNKYIHIWKMADGSGRVAFDKEIAVEEGDIFILEEMGKLAIECLKEYPDERPEMVVVVERLQKLKTDWMEARRKKLQDL
ncbi:hypothetical protein QOZ80_5AG0375270 [Eleusine coracana subsp. coracana]|nr:hypothetical protein QOZ80_5AG0375270 [Eleusine coracana subsp. coracana]